MPAQLALASAIAYEVADFAGGLAARRPSGAHDHRGRPAHRAGLAGARTVSGWRPTLLGGTLASAATVTFLRATRSGPLAVSAVLGLLYLIVVVLLAADG